MINLPENWKMTSNKTKDGYKVTVYTVGTPDVSPTVTIIENDEFGLEPQYKFNIEVSPYACTSGPEIKQYKTEDMQNAEKFALDIMLFVNYGISLNIIQPKY